MAGPTAATQGGSASQANQVNPRKIPDDAICTGMRIRPTVNDGFIVSMDYESTRRSTSGLGSPYVPSRDFTFSDVTALGEHIVKTFGAPKAAEKAKK